MLRTILHRVIQIPVLLLVIYTGTFMLAWVAPGNPMAREGRKPPPEVQEAMSAAYSLDHPFKCYFEYIVGKPGSPQGGLIHGYFGPSLFNKDWDVGQIIAGSLWVSIRLGLASVVLALLIGVPIGILSAVHRGRVIDAAATSLVLVGVSVPMFSIGATLLLVFCLHLKWVPVGWGGFQQMFLPTFTLSLPYAAYIARLTRMGMIDVMTSDFIRTARAKGLSNARVITRHALKVAFLPVLSFLGPALAGAMTGSFVVEKVFNIPGMGQHFVDAVLNKDLFLIMGVVLVYATMLILFNLLVDIAYRLVDPRIDVTG